jgi:sulfite exporter TauE/SafE
MGNIDALRPAIEAWSHGLAIVVALLAVSLFFDWVSGTRTFRYVRVAKLVAKVLPFLFGLSAFIHGL